MSRKLHQQSNRGGAESASLPAKELEIVILRPPHETDLMPPPLANDVRVIGSADAMTIHLYYISPTRVLGATEGRLGPGMTREGNMLIIDSEPVARVALSATTAAELAGLILKTLSEGAPKMLAKLNNVAAMIAEAMKNANEANADLTEPDPAEEA